MNLTLPSGMSTSRLRPFAAAPHVKRWVAFLGGKAKCFFQGKCLFTPRDVAWVRNGYNAPSLFVLWEVVASWLVSEGASFLKRVGVVSPSNGLSKSGCSG